MQRLIPLNTDIRGNAHCIKAGYFKMGWTNFVREWGGQQDGFIATGIIEFYEDD